MSLSLPELVSDDACYRTNAEVAQALASACERHGELASFEELGTSEEGRSLYGIVMGRGDRAVSLIAGNHADEPVGPETLRTLVLKGLARRGDLDTLLDTYRFVIVPHTNPDGEMRNRSWVEQWPDPLAYLQRVVREEPGRDMEFGFPDMRKENRLVAEFLRAHAPYALHMSLHGMGFGEGVMLLVERHWSFRTQQLQRSFLEAARLENLALHDHNRHGEKGFFYIAPGFSTTPEGEAMRTYFRAQQDEEMASRFHDSSMEYVRSLGGDPLCLVTELPLFVIDNNSDSDRGHPTTYLALKDRLADVRMHLARGQRAAAQAILDPFELTPLPLPTAMRLQLNVVEAALDTVDAGKESS